MTDRPEAAHRATDAGPDLDELMRRIRVELAARRAGEEAALPETLPEPALVAAAPPPVAEAPPPPLDPARRRYAVEEFLALHDAAFLRAAYLGVLGREADPPGWKRHLDDLRHLRLSRIGILDAFAASPEGRARGAVIEGLAAKRRRERIKRLPGIRPLVTGLRLLRLLRQLPAWQAQVLDAADQTADIAVRADGAETTARDASEHAARLEAALDARMRAVQDGLAAVRTQAKTASARIGGTEHMIGALEQRFRESSARLDSFAARLDGVAASESVAQLAAELGGLRARLAEQWRTMVDQKLRLEILLAEARRRLPEPFDAAQLGRIAGEQDHLLDAFYVAFEDRYRGTRADIKGRQAVYLPRIRQAAEATGGAPVVDIGCGRGEWLELLKENGIAARGFDLNRIMIEECHQRGLDATLGDALEAIRAMPADSLGAVTGFHIIEHIPFTVLVGLFDECLRVLRPGGVVVFETPNPANLQVAAERFYLDPTHRNPLPSELVAFIAEARGLSRVEVLPLHPMAPPVGSYDDGMLELLRQKLFGPQDYGMIAWKAA